MEKTNKSRPISLLSRYSRKGITRRTDGFFIFTEVLTAYENPTKSKEIG